METLVPWSWYFHCSAVRWSRKMCRLDVNLSLGWERDIAWAWAYTHAANNICVEAKTLASWLLVLIVLNKIRHRCLTWCNRCNELILINRTCKLRLFQLWLTENHSFYISAASHRHIASLMDWNIPAKTKNRVLPCPAFSTSTSRTIFSSASKTVAIV